MSRGNIEENESSPLPFGQLCRRFSLSEVQSATHNFNEALIIGRGGFGTVYKGFFDDEDGTVAAVKRLNPNSNQGAHEFWTEIAMLSKFCHCNLVSLIGYCTDNGEMVLVYEYMPCGTLYDHLHKMPTHLSWIQRLKVCIGAARGLDYLHTGTSTIHRIIHRDVKSSNILLDENLQAKVSDFGLSKVGPANQAYSFVDTNVKGSFGYLDPEYYLLGRLTRKSDVYSFGVVLFEVLSGRRAVDTRLSQEQQNLANWVQKNIKQENLDEIIDSSMQGEILPSCLKEFTKIAEQCLHTRSKKRPTMAEVVVSLESALALQKGTDSLTDEEVFNTSGDSDDQENGYYSFSEGEHSNSAEDKDSLVNRYFTVWEHRNDAVDNDNQANMESTREHEVTGVSGHRDERILGAAGGDQSYIKSADHKVTSSGALEDEHNSQTSFIKGDLIDDSRDSENEKNIGFVPEEVVIDADARYVSGSGSSRGGGHQDMRTLSAASGGQTNTTRTTKMKFTRKLKKIFLSSADHLQTKSSRNSKNSSNSPLSEDGEGGVGGVYKGWIDEKTFAPTEVGVGMAVAVKKDQDRFKVLRNGKLDLNLLGEYSHPNLVKFLTYCLDDEYLPCGHEFMQNGSLERQLSKKLVAEPLAWVRRLEIAVGAARGLAFLHTRKQVTFNQFKTSHILLDAYFNAKLDPELEKLDLADNYPFKTDSYYAAPEWYAFQVAKLDCYTKPDYSAVCFSVSSEVYSFGVVLLEILTGQKVYDATRPEGKQNLVKWAIHLLPYITNLEMVVDPYLSNCYPTEGAFRLALLIVKCLQSKEEKRPSMEEVLKDLEQISAIKMKTKQENSYTLENLTIATH